MSLFNTMNISASGMTAQRLRMDTISQNLANINTTRTDKGDPYRRKILRFEAVEKRNSFAGVLNKHIYSAMGDENVSGGVRVTSILEDKSPFIVKYDPNHPDADEKGYVRLPNINNVEEMTNMIDANRTYEANITALNASKNMLMSALSIGK